jgi:hypothetical protein
VIAANNEARPAAPVSEKRNSDREQEVVSLTPYLWLPTVNGTVAFGSLQVPMHVSPSDYLPGVKGGMMLFTEVNTHRGIKLVSNLLAASWKQNNFQPFLGFNLNVKLAAIEVGAGKELAWKRLSVTPLATFKYVYFSGRYGSPMGATSSNTVSEQGRLGGSADYRFNHRLRLDLRYLREVVGPKGSADWDAGAGVGYRVSRHIMLHAGYIWSRLAAGTSGADAFALRLRSNGPVVGLSMLLGTTRKGSSHE